MKIKCEYSELVDPTQLKSHPENRNKHPQDQINRLAKIIKYQGFRHPIVVSKLSGFIVAGHGRVMAAKKLGLKKVPVDYQDFPDEESEYAFVQSDNAIASWASLDLAEINMDIENLGPDFDLDLLGIKGFDIDPPPPKEDREEEDTDEFLIVIDCKDEREQAQLFQELSDRGLKCKLMQ